MKRSLSRDNRGLTLIEIIVGISIMAIIAVPLLHTFVTGAKTSMKSRTYSDATDAAQNIIEQIQANKTNVFLKNPNSIYTGAQYYAREGSETGGYYYTPLTGNSDLPPKSTDKNYYIGIKNLKSGESEFDALLIVDASSDLNNADVSISNSMDAVIGMAGADDNVLARLRGEYGSYFDHPLTLSGFTREIVIDVIKDDSYYNIDISFIYRGSITYIDNEIVYTDNLRYTENGSTRISSTDSTAEGSPAFSVYMFFKAYYSDKDMITINNRAGSDFNVFLVDVTESPSIPITYSADIQFKSQYDYLTQRVFTNIPLADKDMKYKAFDKNRPGHYKLLAFSGNLVETKKLDRKYLINISLFECGSDFTGEPVLSMDFNKLD